MTYFISGHRDLTWEEFAKWYAPAISRTLSTDNAAQFVVGDCEGADRMAQDYLLACGVSFRNITVYHMFKAPRYTALRSVPTQGGFTSDIERDKAMTEHSDYDIAFIRKGKESSGTAQNILRRWTKPTEKERFESYTSLVYSYSILKCLKSCPIRI